MRARLALLLYRASRYLPLIAALAVLLLGLRAAAVSARYNPRDASLF